SSLARNAMEHLNACWIDARFTNSVLTLELKNMTRYHQLKLTSGMYIGQLKFFRHEQVPPEQSYSVRRRYNHDHSVRGIKRYRWQWISTNGIAHLRSCLTKTCGRCPRWRRLRCSSSRATAPKTRTRPR